MRYKSSVKTDLLFFHGFDEWIFVFVSQVELGICGAMSVT